MKRILIYCFMFIFALQLLQPMLVSASAGDPNIDSGGGNFGEGTTTDFWNTGDEGVRVTIIRASDNSAVTAPIDITNKTPNNIVAHFGSVSKMQYISGFVLTVNTETYQYYNPAQMLPGIIAESSSGNNIDAIRSYFTDEQVIKSITGLVGMNYDVLINGDYRLMVEPVAYMTFGGVRMAMTATEAALYDQQLGGGLRAKMAPLTHQNLPLAMFLETTDLGFGAWNGSKIERATNNDIITFLGVGIVQFTELEPEEIEIDTHDYEYRVNTDVITSVTVSGGQSDPDNPVKVNFRILGVNYNVGNVYYPHGDSQLAWVRWRTPSTPQNITINVTVTGGGSVSNNTITAKIVDLPQSDPPNPVADDRNNNFTMPSVPSKTQRTSAEWGVWSPWWHSYWVWTGYGWVDMGWWEFDYNRYTANLTASMNITPDAKNPTATGKIMKSGYGINQVVTVNISTNQSSAVIGVQNVMTYFPEFGYNNYWRILDMTQSGLSSNFEFKPNQYSTYNRRTHFTPIWMPDGNYTAYTWVFDCWTPVGMLSSNLTDSLTISGNLWSDWHISSLRP